jgi:hypothetical protein
MSAPVREPRLKLRNPAYGDTGDRGDSGSAWPDTPLDLERVRDLTACCEDPDRDEVRSYNDVTALSVSKSRLARSGLTTD